MSQIADDFIEALGNLEQSGNVEPIAALFDHGATISNPLVKYDENDADAAKTFWSHYRGAFDDIKSEFRNILVKDNVSILEWQSEGALDGERFVYDGVSVLEDREGRITAFRTYFDPRQIPASGKTTSGNSDR